MKSFGITSVLLLTLVLASPSTVEAQVLQPGELCGDHADAAIATFEDANLEGAIKAALWVRGSEDLTCGLVSGLTALDAFSYLTGVTSLVGIENLKGLTVLDLRSNSVSDASRLGLLESLTHLYLGDNPITDIASLSGLTSLTSLDLRNMADLTDIHALLDNTGLGAGDRVFLNSTNVSCTDVEALKAKGVTVFSDCR